MRRWTWLLTALLTACTVTPVDPVGPAPVPPTPGPVDPVNPAPTPTNSVSYPTVRTIAAGQDEAVVKTAIGFPPVMETRQDDGTKIARWAAVNGTGAPRWLDVQFEAGKVAGYALLPRVP